MVLPPFSPVYVHVCVQVLVAETQVACREGRVGGAGEVLQEQEVSHWLPGENRLNDSNDSNDSCLNLQQFHTSGQPFVEVCMKSNNKYEAKKYVSKVMPEQKVRAHLAVR